MTRYKYAQNIIEFVFVFIVTMSIFLSIIELTLFWRAQYSVANIANEIVANIQIVAQNTKNESKILDNALKTVDKSAGLLNLSNEHFSVTGDNGTYTIASSYKKQGKNALEVYIKINDIQKSDVSVGVAYIYNGIFLFKRGTLVTSGPVQSIQKF